MAGDATQWMIEAEQEAWVTEHMRLVEEFGYAARAAQVWMPHYDGDDQFNSRLAAELKKMEAAMEAVKAHAVNLACR